MCFQRFKIVTVCIQDFNMYNCRFLLTKPVQPSKMNNKVIKNIRPMYSGQDVWKTLPNWINQQTDNISLCVLFLYFWGRNVVE